MIKVFGAAEACEAGACEAGAEVAFGHPPEQLVIVMTSVVIKVTVSPPDTDVAMPLTTEIWMAGAGVPAVSLGVPLDLAGADFDSEATAEASCCAPAVPTAWAEEASSDAVVAWLALAGTAEEAPEQLKSKRGVVLRVLPTIPKLGFGVFGKAS